MNIENAPAEARNSYSDRKLQILLDIYHTYQSIKNIQEKEILDLPKVRKLLEDAYLAYVAKPVSKLVFILWLTQLSSS